MNGDDLFFTVVGLVAVERLWELALSRKHEFLLLAQGADRARRDGFLAFVVIHTSFFFALFWEWSAAAYSRVGTHTWWFLSLVAVAFALRYWVMATLKERWCARVLRLPNAPLIATGPYQWIRHPNYIAVALELFALPLAFGCVATCIVWSTVNGAALLYRIRVEERFLGIRPSRTAA